MEYTEGSVLSFVPDTRYETVHFSATVDDRRLDWSLPFIGWAVVVFAVTDDTAEYDTAAVAVGLSPKGEPQTRFDLAREAGIDPGFMIQEGLDPIAAGRVTAT